MEICRSTDQDYLSGIQMLRGIAATMVVIHHALEESLYYKTPLSSPDWFTTFGAAGVDIFFVISGFIMVHVSYPKGGRAERPLGFLVKRATRIYPFYWVCCGVVGILAGLGFYSSLHITPVGLFANFLLMPSSRLLIGVAWTLTFELYFYLIFAVGLAFQSMAISILFPSLTIAVLFGVGHVLPTGLLRDHLVNPISFEFCLGLLVAYLKFENRLPTWLLRYGWVFGFAIICLAPLLIRHDNTNGLPPMSRVLVWGVPACLIIGSFLAIERSQSWVRLTSVLIGNASYAIYLTHPFVMITYARVLRMSPLFAGVPPIVVAIIAAIALGCLGHLFIEAPLMRYLRDRRGYRLIIGLQPRRSRS